MGWNGILPVRPINPMTAPLCATSKNLRPRAMTTSILLSCARLAAWWAARRRATRCSGVSPAIGGWFGLDDGGEGPPDREKREASGFVVEEDRGFADVLDPAWGVVGVNRVASETDRATMIAVGWGFRGCLPVKVGRKGVTGRTKGAGTTG